MFSELPETTRLVFQGLAGLLMITGATIDLYLAVRVQTRRAAPWAGADDTLRQRPFTALHARAVVFATLLFAVPILFQKPGAATPSNTSLIVGPLLYALASLLITLLCLTHTRTSFRDAFSSPRCTLRRALGKGLLYGLAAVPPVVMLSLVMTSVTEGLGYESRLQEVFDWLGDDSLATGTRLFMVLAATVIAPLAEETLFRGILLPTLLKNRSFLFAALLTGTYFALIHFHAPSFLPLLALSLAFSAGYAATGSLVTPIVMHAVFNLTSLLFYLADKA